MKTVFCMSLCIFTCLMAQAKGSPERGIDTQQDSLADVFPLGIGNAWTYHYDLFWWNQICDEYITEIGSVNMSVTGRVATQDSNRWVIRQTRDLVRNVTSSLCGNNGTFQIRDTTDIEMVELFDSFHHIYNRTQPYWSVFPFPRDSSLAARMVYRYQIVDSLGNARIIREPFDTLTFHVGIGLTRVDKFGIGISINHQLTNWILSSVDNEPDRNSLKQFELQQNFPNPFNPRTTIEFTLHQAADVTLTVFDVLGRKVMALAEARKPKGSHRISIEADRLPSGVYFYRLESVGYVQTRKMVILR